MTFRNQNHPHGNAFQTAHSSGEIVTSGSADAPPPSAPTGAKPVSRTGSRSTYSMMLKSELLGIHPSSGGRSQTDRFTVPSSASSASPAAFTTAYDQPVCTWNASGSGVGGNAAFHRMADASTVSSSSRPASTGNLLRFKAPRQSLHDEVKSSATLFTGVAGRSRLRALAGDAHEPRRKIAPKPFKILDAPALQDDFYLNLVDWSAANVVAVGLGAAVFLWSASTGKVSKLCDLGAGDAVTSVAWSQRVRFGVFDSIVVVDAGC